MKKILLSLVAMFAFLSLANAQLTYTVTVPAGTNVCYIAGSMTGTTWPLVAMTKVDATHYTYTSATATAADTYKYSAGSSWDYVEKTAAGGDVDNRAYSAADVVAAWKAVYDPNAQVSYVNITAKIQSTLGTPYIWWWGAGSQCADASASLSWPGAAMTAGSDNWYSYTFSNVQDNLGVSIIITADATGGTKLVDSKTIMQSTCYNESGTVVTCPSTGINNPSFDVNVYATAGTITVGAENFSILTLAGVDVTAQNGSLVNGQYIVKLANGAAQVVVLK